MDGTVQCPDGTGVLLARGGDAPDDSDSALLCSDAEVEATPGSQIYCCLHTSSDTTCGDDSTVSCPGGGFGFSCANASESPTTAYPELTCSQGNAGQRWLRRRTAARTEHEPSLPRRLATRADRHARIGHALTRGSSERVSLKRTCTRRRHSNPSALLGRRLGEFELREKIGEGGFGSIYRAEQVGLEREAVVKVLRTDLAADEKKQLRFLREAKLASSLDHPYAAHV